MRMRTFVAPTLAEAMERLRLELGNDAFVIATDEPEGGPVRIVAAAGEGFEDAPSAAMADAEAQTEAPPARPASALATLFLRHGVPERLAAILRRGEIEADALAENLHPALASHFDFAPLDPARMTQPMLLAGPPGCGKTSTIAKIASLLRSAGRNVQLITTDTLRAAGIEQIRRYGEVLGCGVTVASSSAELAAAMRDGPADTPATLRLIDTPGLDLVRRDDRQSLLDWCEAAETTPVLVLPGARLRGAGRNRHDRDAPRRGAPAGQHPRGGPWRQSRVDRRRRVAAYLRRSGRARCGSSGAFPSRGFARGRDRPVHGRGPGRAARRQSVIPDTGSGAARQMARARSAGAHATDCL
jgi:flagellar biosynthesis protein FlhF